ncbi:hypothetical protein [Psychroflexus halocasei]|uniref:hypothetical protein n=1 Tax=Psychroflexus halocasei TaxID=908615 RepID=UPI00117B5490|nr:hypothetical protein [Psychroflexus halocasei]
MQWNNVKLFDNDTTQFKVAANAVENRETIYASVMVFDMNNNDLLSKNSIYKAKLIDYFSKMIRANKPNKTKFYRRYWQKVDPERWEEIRKYREKRIYSKDRKHQVYR